MYWWELGRAAALRDEPVTSFFGACRHADSTAGCSTALTMLVGDRAHGASMSKPCECQSISLLSCCGSAVPAYSLGPHSPCLQLYSPVRHFAMAPPCQSLANASLSRSYLALVRSYLPIALGPTVLSAPASAQASAYLRQWSKHERPRSSFPRCPTPACR